MGCTRHSRHIASSLQGDFARSTVVRSGRQKLKANIVSLHGFSFRKRFIRRMSCSSRGYSATRFVPCVTRSVKLRLTLVCIAASLRKFGDLCIFGRGASSVFRSLGLRCRIGGTRRFKQREPKTGVEWRPSSSTRLGMFGMKETDAFSLGFRFRQHGCWT